MHCNLVSLVIIALVYILICMYIRLYIYWDLFFKQTDRYLYQLEQSLRSFLLKINMADSLLNPLPRDCTWTVHATTRESAAAQVFDKNVEDNFPWLEASEKETAMDNSSILPLKSTTSPYINMQLYVEETKHFKDS